MSLTNEVGALEDTTKNAHLQTKLRKVYFRCDLVYFLGFIYLLTPCLVLLAADGVGPRNVVGFMLFLLLIYILLLASAMLARADVV